MNTLKCDFSHWHTVLNLTLPNDLHGILFSLSAYSRNRNCVFWIHSHSLALLHQGFGCNGGVCLAQFDGKLSSEATDYCTTVQQLWVIVHENITFPLCPSIWQAINRKKPLSFVVDPEHSEARMWCQALPSSLLLPPFRLHMLSFKGVPGSSWFLGLLLFSFTSLASTQNPGFIRLMAFN